MKRYRFCPVCGSSLESSPRASGVTSLLACGACGFEFWQNSKPAVGACVVRLIDGEPRVLLTRRGIDPYRGMWDFPGGFLINGERPEAGLAREMREELNVSIARPRLMAAEVDEYLREDVAEEARFVLGLYYRCEIPEDAVPTPGDDVTEARWFPLADLPARIAFESNRRALEVLRSAVAAERPGQEPSA